VSGRLSIRQLAIHSCFLEKSNSVVREGREKREKYPMNIPKAFAFLALFADLMLFDHTAAAPPTISLISCVIAA
jgi:hypothetical protein